MQINFTGIIAATTAFLGIWLGHVSVRAIERRVTNLWLPIVIALVLGLILETWSLMTDHRLLSTALGILGITVLWDAFEFVRQEKRVKRGHAPANPDNPRHARILTGYPSATTRDLLNRNPIGHSVTSEEAIQLITPAQTAKPGRADH
jgi:hypothetical protein